VNTLEEAIAKRDQYLKENPHLQSYQDQIDDIMDKCKPEDRKDALLMMMHEKVTQLSEQMINLKDALTNDDNT
jgi:predicted metalloenzyme YecM